MRKATNREVEVKLRIADVPALVRDLRRLGAVSHGRVFEQNTIYDTPASDFRLAGRLLRLRLETPSPIGTRLTGNPRAVLTSKAPPSTRGKRASRSRYKERLERELAVQGAAAWPAILRSLGLRPGFRYEKYRTTYRLPGLHLDLDETPVGVFLELEGSPRAIDRAARALGFITRDYIRGTYWDVYAAECRRRGRPPKNMVFRV